MLRDLELLVKMKTLDIENIVALVIAPGIDYHWYKQDSDGYWSHKPETEMLLEKIQ